MPRGAFVILDSLTHEGVLRGARTAASLSDAVVRPSLHCYAAGLDGTLAYFGDRAALHATAKASLEAALGDETRVHGPGEGPTPGSEVRPIAHAPGAPPGVRVVFGRHTLRAYLYACANPAAHGEAVAFADSLHLGYRRFKEALDWEEWRTGTLQFCALLRYTSSERAALASELARFVRHMRQMRYEGPFSVPRDLPSEDFARRFGRLVAGVWEHWRLEDDGFRPPRPWRAEPQDLDPSAFVTHHWETSEWENALALSPERAEAVLRSTFEVLLFKVRARDLPGRRHGVSDLLVRLCFNDGVEIVREARLARPVNEPGRLLDLVLSDLCARLPLGEKEHVSPRDPSWVVTLHTLRQLTLEPLGIACVLEAASDDLFASHRPVDVEDVCFALRLRSARWNLARYGLRANLDPRAGVMREETGAIGGPATGAPHVGMALAGSVPKGIPPGSTPRTATPHTATLRTATPRTATPRTATPHTATPRAVISRAERSPFTGGVAPRSQHLFPDDGGPLFALAHHARPSLLLREARPVSLPALRLRSIEYTETLDDSDYFIGVPHAPDTPRLWLSAPVASRALPREERPWHLVGAFS